MMEGKKKNKAQYKTVSDEDTSLKKKVSMKTATNVVNRILWDESIPQDDITVGYLDRFEGVVEQSFSFLDWRNPAIVDNYSLALPKHRIMYFKYQNRKIWDKKSRTDIVFGSTGYPISIHEFMKMVDSEILNFHDENIDSDGFIHQEITCAPTILSEEKKGDEREPDMIGRPNFFIAARIENENTVCKLKEVSDHIKSRDETLSECCIPPEMLHLTLSILQLNSPNDISNAITALETLSSKHLPNLTLTLEGLDHFKHRVLFSQISENKGLDTLRQQLVDELASKDVLITDRFSFVPHVTIAKLSRPVSALRHSKFIDQYLYLKFEDNLFGVENINKLYLCEMGAARREDGFYRCAHEINLTNQ